MEGIREYCPMTDICPHEPVKTIPNSYFLIQPFDDNKEDRENAIQFALRKFYGSDKKYKLEKADSELNHVSVYCEICKKIKLSQFCIVDLTGEIYDIIDAKSRKTETKIFLRPNVALELGMAFGFNKPALILSRKLNGKRLIPSDIEFIRYIDISLIEFKGWTGASQKLLDRLGESVPLIYFKKSLYIDKIAEMKCTMNYCKTILYLKEKSTYLKNKNFTLNQIVCPDNRLIGIIREGEDLEEGLCFNFYILENEIELLVGQLKCLHVQPTGVAQVELYPVEGSMNYLNEVAKCCFEREKFVPGKHRLELIIPQQIKSSNTGELRNIINSLSSFISI